MSEFPRMFRVRQTFDDTRVASIPDAVAEQLSGSSLAAKVRPGQSVAISVGSRGIANIAEIVRAIVDYVKSLGGVPFIVPAMGSHGGGTAEGQAALLGRYGVTDAAMGCEIRSSMETVVVAQAKEGFDVHFDRHASTADHVIVCNRIKPHTRFVGEIESGLMKMLLIGLGKRNGAVVYHQAIQNFSFGQIIRSVAGEVLNRCPIALGVAILENGYDETAAIQAVEPQQFESHERKLLLQARAMMPALPFDRADLLIVDKIGKDISGAGMDTNIVGRKYNDHVAREDEFPKIHQIYARGLTAATAGNATGVGLAEYCHQRLVDQMDPVATRINCLTGGHVTAAMVPIHFPTDREVLAAAITQAGLVAPADVRWMWAPNTLEISEVLCSEAYWNQVADRPSLQIVHPPEPIRFDADDQLLEVF
ncbi:lactate racemase domain-containing protein [Rosistilla oblonga]|uniref:lactate racemase domain-containing protein n=1 Tax=Rosistilla oblonga TaxID=2527990 RepID=UPI003A97AB42